MKKVIGLIVAICMISGIVPILADTGSNVTWRMEDGVLHIEGYGDMPDFDMGENYHPSMFTYAEEVVIHEGVQSIGEFAFYHCNMKKVTVPTSVKKIGKCAFFWCDRLTEVEMSEGLEVIDNMAFSDCFELEEIKIPESVRVLYGAVFLNCKSLKELRIPDNVEYVYKTIVEYCESLEKLHIGKNAHGDEISFYRAENVREITVSEKNASYTVRDGALLDKDETLVIKCFMKDGGEYKVPVSVEYIMPDAFSGCEGLAVYLPENIDEKKLNIEPTSRFVNEKIYSEYERIEYMGDVIFYEESKWTIGSDADETIIRVKKVEDNNSDKTVRFPKSFGDYDNFELSEAVVRIDGIETIDLSDMDKTYIRMFDESEIKNVILPESLKVINQVAFSGCRNLKSITLPEGLERIEHFAFYNSGLEEIEIPSTVSYIASNAFALNGKLKKIVIKEGKLEDIAKIDQLQCFNSISEDAEVYIPKTVKLISNNAFRNFSYGYHGATMFGDFPEGLKVYVKENSEGERWAVRNNVMHEYY